MRMNKSVEKQVPAPDIQRRINGGWLRLWRTVWPNIPPPVKVQSLKSKVQSLEAAKSKVSRLGSKVPTPTGGVQSLKSNVQSPEADVRGSRFNVQGSKFSLSPSESRPAAVGYLSRFLCAGFALALLATGCTGPHPLKGGKAATTRNEAGVIQQTVVQGENASQPSKQDQETIKMRTYTLPAATRIEQCQASVPPPASVRTADKNVRAPSRSQACGEHSALNSQLPATAEAS